MNVITIGKRLVPAEQIALVEPFDPASNPEFQSDKAFKGRVVLLNRDTVLTEMTPREFAEAYGLRLLAEDNIAVSQTVAFRVEIFTPTETFKPERAYLTRLKWFDPDGNAHSKLLVTEPQIVIEELTRREGKPVVRPDGEPPRRPATRPARGRKGSRRMEAFEN
jgi:hypothetical protein